MKGATQDTYKKELDSYLSTIPDQPTLAGTQRAAESNSLIDQIFYKNWQVIKYDYGPSPKKKADGEAQNTVNSILFKMLMK